MIWKGHIVDKRYAFLISLIFRGKFYVLYPNTNSIHCAIDGNRLIKITFYLYKTLAFVGKAMLT